jgi:hypothetical protein
MDKIMRFKLQKVRFFATFALSLLTIQAGWNIDSNYLLDDKKLAAPQWILSFSTGHDSHCQQSNEK